MSTPVIKIAVSQADATLIQSVTLTAGMVSLPEVKFSFTDEWTGLGKKAIVRAGNTAKEVLITNNKIIVPVECLATAGVDLIIGVYGADETVVLPTVWCACGEILDGTDTSGADNQGEATTTLVDQMLAYAADIEAIAETLEDYAIRNVEVNTTGANQYGIATVTLADTGSGDDRTITFHFSNLKGNGIESITWSAAGEYRGRIQITESSGRVTNFDALIDAINYLESLINDAEAWAVGTIDGEDIPDTHPAYQNSAKYHAGMAEDAEEGAETAQEAAETAQGKAEDAQTAAETAQGKAEDAQAAAEAAATSAATDAGLASGSADSAASAAANASDSALDASGYANTALAAKDAAETAQEKAETAQTKAEQAQSAAETARADAISAKNDSVSAKNDSESAKNASVAAKTAAETAQGKAETAQGKAEDAQTAAEAAQGLAEAAQTAAEGSAADAAASAAAAEEYLGYAESWVENETLFLNKGSISNETLYI